ncbi:hypothetical protein LINPERHAP2_LOCUS40817, partial [Linum perenne]
NSIGIVTICDLLFPIPYRHFHPIPASQAITDATRIFFFDFISPFVSSSSPTHPSSPSSFSSIISHPVAFFSDPSLTSPSPLRSHLLKEGEACTTAKRQLKGAAAHMANNTAATVSTDLSAKRLRDQDQHGTSAPAPAGEAIETETAAVAADKGTSNLSVVIPGWFFENSPMWPDMLRSQLIFKRLTLTKYQD